jgi:PAS domain S-box-containing protein
MSATLEQTLQENGSHLESILDEPEQVVLRRLLTLVEHLFRVPVAYVGLLGLETEIVTRIGSGVAEYGKYLPLTKVLREPFLVKDTAAGAPKGCHCGDIRFVAAVPLRSSHGMDLGLLVIADRDPRPDFSEQDLQALKELAAVFAGKMELRMIASEALDSGRALQEAELRFRSIANTVPVLLIYGTADGPCTFVNKTFQQFTGRPMEAELGDGWAESIHPDYRPVVQNAYWEAFEAKRRFTVEFPMRRHDGVYRWMLAGAAPRFLHDGKFAGFAAYMQDITDHHDALSGLRRQEQCSIAIAEASGAVYALLDSDSHIVQASPGFAEIANGAVEDWPAGVAEAFKQAMAGGTTVRNETPGHHWTLTPLRAPAGEPASVAVTIT